jgi:hypothetical protein
MPDDDYCKCECCLYWRDRISEVSGEKEQRANRAERALAQAIKTLRAAQAAAKASMRFTSHNQLD